MWAGYRLKLDYSAKLFSLTFLLVTFGAMQSKGGPPFLTLTKTGACFPPYFRAVIIRLFEVHLRHRLRQRLPS